MKKEHIGPNINEPTLTLDELLVWLNRLAKSQDPNIPTNVVDIRVDNVCDQRRKIELEIKY